MKNGDSVNDDDGNGGGGDSNDWTVKLPVLKNKVKHQILTTSSNYVPTLCHIQIMDSALHRFSGPSVDHIYSGIPYPRIREAKHKIGRKE